MPTLPHGYPIVYQDVMRVVVAGPLGQPYVGINRRNEREMPLVLTLAEARELAAALRWALDEYDQHMGNGSFYPHAERKRVRHESVSEGGGEHGESGRH